MRAEVVVQFDKWIADLFKEKEDIRKFLLNHPRKNLCIDNLCEQIKIAEARLYKITFEVKEYEACIETVARMFCSAAVQSAEEAQLSSIEKIRRRTEADKESELTGIIKEMVKDGLILDPDRNDLKLGAEDGGQDQTQV